MDAPRNSPNQVDAAHPIGAVEARQGEIVLRRPGQRSIFIAGLVGAVLAAMLIAVLFG